LKSATPISLLPALINDEQCRKGVGIATRPTPMRCRLAGLMNGGNLRARNVFVTAAGFARIYMKIATSAYFRKQGDAGDVFAAYFRNPMYLKHHTESFIRTQGVAVGLGYARLSALPNTVRGAAAGGFAYIYMVIAAFDPKL
jgi:hypothetical protein